MQFRDKTNSKFFIYEGNHIVVPFSDTANRLIINLPEVNKPQTLVRCNTVDEYNQFIIDKNISIATSYEDENGEIIEVPQAPFQADPTQVKGVLNLGSEIWVLKRFENKGVLFPFPMVQGGFIPLNELDYGFDQEVLIFNYLGPFIFN